MTRQQACRHHTCSGWHAYECTRANQHVFKCIYLCNPQRPCIFPGLNKSLAILMCARALWFLCFSVETHISYDLNPPPPTHPLAPCMTVLAMFVSRGNIIAWSLSLDDSVGTDRWGGFLSGAGGIKWKVGGKKAEVQAQTYLISPWDRSCRNSAPTPLSV